MSNQRHPDSESSIKNRSLEEILDWLSQRCTNVTPLKDVGGTHSLEVELDACRIPVMIHERAVGKAWISIWFRSDQTPWIRDIDCAHEVAAALDTQVRCVASGWNEGDDPDEWWAVENGNAKKIQWQTQ
jgi:hypothetical protein